jgi:hypothetical protein
MRDDLLLLLIAELCQFGLVGAQPSAVIASEEPRRLSVFLRRRARLLVPALGDIGFEHLVLVIDRLPEIVHLAVDLHTDLVEVPLPLTEASHAAYLLPADIAGKERSEPVSPLEHGLVTNVYAALERQVFDIPQ